MLENQVYYVDPIALNIGIEELLTSDTPLSPALLNSILENLPVLIQAAQSLINRTVVEQQQAQNENQQLPLHNPNGTIFPLPLQPKAANNNPHFASPTNPIRHPEKVPVAQEGQTEQPTHLPSKNTSMEDSPNTRMTTKQPQLNAGSEKNRENGISIAITETQSREAEIAAGSAILSQKNQAKEPQKETGQSQPASRSSENPVEQNHLESSYLTEEKESSEKPSLSASANPTQKSLPPSAEMPNLSSSRNDAKSQSPTATTMGSVSAEMKGSSSAPLRSATNPNPQNSALLQSVLPPKMGTAAPFATNQTTASSQDANARHNSESSPLGIIPNAAKSTLPPATQPLIQSTGANVQSNTTQPPVGKQPDPAINLFAGSQSRSERKRKKKKPGEKEELEEDEEPFSDLEKDDHF